MAQRPTKAQRLAAAREADRLAHAEAQKRLKRRRILVPAIVTAAIAVVAVIIAVIVINQPGPATERVSASAGPANMNTGGIAFQAVPDGGVQPVSTPALAANTLPTARQWPGTGKVDHIRLYVDWTCPACKSFEEDNLDTIMSRVASGSATLEVFPISILGNAYSTDFSLRATNAAACVADTAPDAFLDAQKAMYAAQPEEGSAGLSDTEILDVLHGAGVPASVDACVTGGTFSDWVSVSTQRITGTAALNGPLAGGGTGFSTPTLVVNDVRWDRTTDATEFIRTGKN
ncbi:DsbA family protein [Microbacterium gorillae]|uniref:DsbA family protein n=1 Tax=Microbacterium gorillae TaxID=1231063 RepID=UPI00058E9B1C|nr:thioredoxin domain-containing protein [Microbacterium gorillae]